MIRKFIKNNVLPGTFGSITVLWLATYDAPVNSISGLWHTEYWLLYVLVLTMNGILFMIGDNQLTNKIAGFLLLLVVAMPTTVERGLVVEDWPHYLAAVLFFIIKSLNHRKYDVILITLGGATLFILGYSIYQIEIVGLYTLVYTGYLKKKNYFRKTRTHLKRNK